MAERSLLLYYSILILFRNINMATRGRPRRFPKGDGSPVASPPKAEVESGATMIGKPFDRARRREISALGKAILLSENSMILIYVKIIEYN